MTNLLRSRQLGGFAHGFNLRTGGSSEGPYRSFNLGRHVGDDPTRVEDNHARLAAAVGYPAGALFEAEQVHGRAVLRVAAGSTPDSLRTTKADALVAFGAGLAVGVRVADCVPILVCDTRTGGVAAIHAGWRGVLAGVIDAAVTALQPQASARDGLRVAIFPHIASCCFEVGEEVAQALLATSPDPSVVDRARRKPHVDLRAIAVAKLAKLGIGSGQIDSVSGCTRCDPKRFFSFRRDGARSGRHVAAIVAR